MKQHSLRLSIATQGPGFADLTAKIRKFVADSKIASGLLTVFVPHTSASLLIQENADPDVLSDLKEVIITLTKQKPFNTLHINQLGSLL